MSADTGMGEVVLTARKGSQGRSGIVYACIHEPFKTAAEAAETARALRHGLTGGGAHFWAIRCHFIRWGPRRRLVLVAKRRRDLGRCWNVSAIQIFL